MLSKFIIVLLAACPVLFAGAQETPAALYTVDIASPPPSLPAPAALKMGTAVSPSGETLGCNSSYLLKDGQPWYPVMGEISYSRCKSADWESSILKMKACGIRVITAYIIWNHHEETEGHFDWSGDRDLRAFLKLCGRHDLYVWLRIGPWSHAEARNGGFPDWLMEKHVRLRSDDSAYLSYVRRFFDASAAQCKGLLFKDGGPLIGIQLENELVFKQPEVYAHMLRLKAMAIQAGYDVPFYSAFAQGPDRQDEFLTPLGGYPDSPWGTTTKMIYKPVYFIRPLENDSQIGSDLLGSIDTRVRNTLPKLSAEIGSGMQATYHRRVTVSPADVGAVALTRIASGLNGLGYYLFHGGMDPVGHTTLQESRVSGYPNDMPYINYDFEAPVGAMGILRPSYRELRLFNTFLGDFGSKVCTEPAFFPRVRAVSNFCADTVQVSVRLLDGSGFIFLSNYQRHVHLPAVAGFQLHLRASSGAENIPAVPISIPADSYTIWPYNLDMGGVILHYATAQPFCLLHNGSHRTYVFFSQGSAEFVFPHLSPGSVRNAVQSSVASRDCIVTHGDTAASFDLVMPADTITILVLTREQALHAAKFTAGDKETLIIGDADPFFDGSKLSIESNSSESILYLFPRRKLRPASSGFTVRPGPKDVLFTSYTLEARFKPQGQVLVSDGTKPTADSAETQRYEDSILHWYASSPRFNRLQPGPLYQRRFHRLPGDRIYRLRFRAPVDSTLRDWIAETRYSGDVLALYKNGQLFYDDFDADGVCRFKLSYLDAWPGDSIQVQVLAFHPYFDVYTEPAMNEHRINDWPHPELAGVGLKPVYTFDVGIY